MFFGIGSKIKIGVGEDCFNIVGFFLWDEREIKFFIW